MATIRIPGALRTLTGGASDVEVTAATVRGALAELDLRYPGIAARIMTGDVVKPFVRIYVGEDDIGALAGLDTPVTARDEIAIVPAIAGGVDTLAPRQRERYARHIQLPEIGATGQCTILGDTARLATRERAAHIAGAYLAAGGVGTLVVPNASEAERDDLAAFGADTRIATEGGGHEVTLDPPPAWWPATDGDADALAFYRGGLAAARWLARAASR